MIGRARTIQPGTFTDAVLWDLAVGTGLPILQAFEGLWCYADREGRFEWKPRELKALILPFWSGDFEQCLLALAGAKRVVAYEVGGRKYGLVPNFKKHQYVHVKEAESRLPGPEETARPVRKTADLGVPVPFSSGSDLSDPADPDPTCLTQPKDLTGSSEEKKSPFRSDGEREVFGYWARKLWPLVHKHGEPRATPPRLSKIRARLQEGRTVADLKRAIDAVSESEFHLGKNDAGMPYIEPKTIFRNAETVDQWLSKRTGTAPGAADHEERKRDELLLEQARAGEWGELAQRKALDGTINLERFKAAVRDRRLTRRAPIAPRDDRRPAAPVQALLGQIGRQAP